MLFATEKGTVKKTQLKAYSNPRAGGIIGINIDKGDRLLDVRLIHPEMTVLLATAQGYAIHFREADDEGPKTMTSYLARRLRLSRTS